MRKIHTIALAFFGVALAAVSSGFALAADSPAPQLTRRAVVPAIAGDNSTFQPGQATPTPLVTSGCAGFRTEVKLLKDAAASFSRNPQESSVSALAGLERPVGIGDSTSRLAPGEARVVEVQVTLVGYSRTANGGIELAIAQGPGGYGMIASFPGPSCALTAAPAEAAAISSARTALVLACGNPPDSGIYEPLAGKATLRGVPFWGKLGGNGSAASGIELGPVLSFQMDPATSCDPNVPDPTPTPKPSDIALNISIAPRVVAIGGELTFTVITAPPVSGILCSYTARDNANAVFKVGEQQATGLDGKASWTFVIPAGVATGEYAGVQPQCAGLQATASARVEIQP